MIIVLAQTVRNRLNEMLVGDVGDYRSEKLGVYMLWK